MITNLHKIYSFYEGDFGRMKNEEMTAVLKFGGVD
jgi:hypothetical protein